MAEAIGSCSWCGEAIELDDGFRVYEPAGERAAAFCRLEHVVPWAIRGAHWAVGSVEASEPAGVEPEGRRCSHCDAQIGDVHVLLVRHRGAHRIGYDFCSVEHLRAWAGAGGRWQ